ncbi:kinase phosphorylation protein-domain-containing protein [Hyaloraphidium curvatum]|nr:kinase phosphorylation protein-domain-containing protein [Hyaloraphidium curvatum]
MDPLFHPTREGSRGGRDQFNWDAVKDDKYRENYLGHSLLAPVGRWQKNRDLTWYAKDGAAAGGKTAAELEAEELERIKLQEAELLAEALGYKGPKKHLAPPSVSTAELKHAIKKEQEGNEETASPLTAEDAKGLGFGKRGSMMEAPTAERLEGTGNLDAFTAQALVRSTAAAAPAAAMPASVRQADGKGAADEAERKRLKRLEKEERRRRKKEKKEARRRAKEVSRRDGGDSRDRRRPSPSDSSSSEDDGGRRRRSPSRERDGRGDRPRHDGDKRPARSPSPPRRTHGDGRRRDDSRDRRPSPRRPSPRRARSRSRSPPRQAPRRRSYSRDRDRYRGDEGRYRDHGDRDRERR